MRVGKKLTLVILKASPDLGNTLRLATHQRQYGHVYSLAFMAISVIQASDGIKTFNMTESALVPT